VWRAWTEPELLRRWWGGHLDMLVVEVDLRVGGRWRYVIGKGDHEVAAFHGEFRELTPQERILTTEIYEAVPEPEPGEEVINVVTFTEHDGRTTLDLLVVCPSREVRDAIIATGMESGMQEQMDMLDELVSSSALDW